MVKSNRYSPTNKQFKTHFENFASEKVKKGHLGKGERDSEDTSTKSGTLVRIDRKKIYADGWEVKIDGKTKKCTYGGNVVSIPPCTKTNTYLVPKKTCEVDVQIDKVSKIYSIIKIKDVNLTPIALYDNEVLISTNTNTDTNSDSKASIKVTRTGVDIKGDITAQTIVVDGDVQSANITTLESDVDKLKDKTSNITQLQQQVIELQNQINELKGDNTNAG